MKEKLLINRIVPNIYSNDLEKTKAFYCDFLGMQLLMDMGWVMTFGSRNNPTAQINVLKNQEGAPLKNEGIFLSVEVSDVNSIHKLATDLHLEIVYPITDEVWKVRRFFVKDPNGATINLLSHNN